LARARVSIFTGTILLIAMSWVMAQQSPTESVPFSIPAGGAASFITGGNVGPLRTGFARVLKSDPFTVTPDGFAILQFRPNNVLVSETTVPASHASLFDDLYVEVDGAVNTGVVIANPNPLPATISFDIRNAGPGSPVLVGGNFTIPPNSQVARFINEPPFNSPVPHVGFLSIISSVPVAAIALRGFRNERSEFIMTTLLQGRPVQGVFTNVRVMQRTVVGYIPVFADGGGWTTQVVMANPTHADLAGGEAEFIDPNGGATSTSEIPGEPGGNILRMFTSGAGSNIRVGHIRITAGDHSAPFNAFAILSLKREGITVSATSVPVVRPGSSFRLHVEDSNAPQLRTSLAISNASALPATVLLELVDLSGSPTGFTATVVIAPFGQLSQFLREIPGLEALPLPFRGTLQISTQSPEGISAIGLRGRQNERGDFLLSTVLSAEPNAASEINFAPVVEGGGYSTEIVLLNGSGTSARGSIVHFKP